MARFNVPPTPNTYPYSIADLLGVDYNDTVVDNRRSPLMINLVNNNGFLESRYGHKILINVGDGKINGVWNVDANNEIFVVHCGTNLYEVDKEFKTKVLVKQGLADTHSCGLYLNGELLILDGLRALVYHKVDDDWTVDYLDTIGYIPEVTVGLKPDGTRGTSYMPINLCSKYEIFTYLSDGASTEYILPPGNYDKETPVVTKLGTSGTFETVTVSSWDKTTGKITFASAIEKSPVDGRDNVKIKVKNNAIVCHINKCKFGVLYGYQGNNNRIFVSGNSDYPNVDWHCDLQDSMHYFPEATFVKVGISPITGYSRINNGGLVIHKGLTDTDASVYYRTFAMSNGEEVFPLSSGVKNIGCLNHTCCANFINDPLFLSENGVYSLLSASGTNDEHYATERSYYINKKLLAEEDLDKAIAIVNKNRYYLAINNRVYIADKRFRSSSNYSETNTGSNGDYQYEWFLLEDVPVSAWFNWNGTLYFGDNEGNIRTFDKTRYYDDKLVDGEITHVPFKVYYETPFLYLGNYTNAKTIRRLFAHVLPNVETALQLSYITADGKVIVTTMSYDGKNPFPKTIQEKEKVSKIMSCKIVIEGLDNIRCSFNDIIIEYRLAGKYRGE